MGMLAVDKLINLGLRLCFAILLYYDTGNFGHDTIKDLQK